MLAVGMALAASSVVGVVGYTMKSYWSSPADVPPPPSAISATSDGQIQISAQIVEPAIVPTTPPTTTCASSSSAASSSSTSTISRSSSAPLSSWSSSTSLTPFTSIELIEELKSVLAARNLKKKSLDEGL